ncbi:hypothetical protein D1224_01470 [Henriciella barbarensis]|uniref:Uncharacterized protein n=1 Tax=Henriciella barbarensis TaxID=86342 RepID=A0A399R7G0_9PROT|nr:hypothetical protein [Henriciella barbarensis]RIJ25817.1 hypothetical protein D1224_01470 [Henriciella barbarensis]
MASDAGTPTTADQLWRDTMRVFSNFRGMRPRKSWLSGLSVGTGPKRLERLTNSKGAAQLMPKLEALSDRELSVFRTFGRINLEQAEAAMRLSLIANITIPVGFLVILNQLFPGPVQNVFEYSGPEAMLGGIGLVAVILLMLIWYSYAGVFQARDISHLAAIAAAKRGAGLSDEKDGGDGDEAGPLEAVEPLL